ncbi:hypothetical protein CPB86DRAFT_825625 [Serendipita vermifera]|nr:hypothetical protein CPB86DRAFT_825625 [Serendipita vermifera]
MLLPNHPTSTISDPLSVLDSDEEKVSYWTFLRTLLEPIVTTGQHQRPNWEKSFIDLDFKGGDGSLDHSILFEFVSDPLTSNLIKRIIKVALSLDRLIPEGSLPTLGSSCPVSEDRTNVLRDTAPSRLTLSHNQLLSLLCHQILGTLFKPDWMTWSGPNLSSIWFADDERGDPRIKRAYVKVLLSFLQEYLPLFEEETGEKYIHFELLDLPRPSGGQEGENHQTADQIDSILSFLGDKYETSLHPQALVPLRITLLEEEDDDCPILFSLDSEAPKRESKNKIDGYQIMNATKTVVFCQLVSANKEIGFGSAATQEERIFGACPLLLPAVLFTPVLSETQGLLVSGDSQLWARFTGHLRSAQLRQIYSLRPSTSKEESVRCGRSFLFLDAEEMDTELHGKDLDKKVMLREMRKLATGFRGLLNSGASPLGSTNELVEARIPANSNQKGDRKQVVLVIPPWGCGTFGGDFKVKLLLIWLVASLYGIPDQHPKRPLDDSDSSNGSKVWRDGIKEIRLAVKKSWWEALDEDWRIFVENLAGNLEADEETSKLRSVVGLWGYLHNCSEEGRLRVKTLPMISIALGSIVEGASFFCTRFEGVKHSQQPFLSSPPTEHRLSGHQPAEIQGFISNEINMEPVPGRELFTFSYPIATSQEQHEAFLTVKESSHDHCKAFLSGCTFDTMQSEDLTPGQIGAMVVEGTIEDQRWKYKERRRMVILGDVAELSIRDVVDKLIAPIVPTLSALQCVGILRPEGAFPELPSIPLELCLNNIPVKWLSLADLSYGSASMLYHQQLFNYTKKHRRVSMLFNGSLVDLLLFKFREVRYFLTTSKDNQASATLGFFKDAALSDEVVLRGLSLGLKGTARIKLTIEYSITTPEWVVIIEELGSTAKTRAMPVFGIDGVIGALPE